MKIEDISDLAEFICDADSIAKPLAVEAGIADVVMHSKSDMGYGSNFLLFEAPRVWVIFGYFYGFPRPQDNGWLVHSLPKSTWTKDRAWAELMELPKRLGSEGGRIVEISKFPQN